MLKIVSIMKDDQRTPVFIHNAFRQNRVNLYTLTLDEKKALLPLVHQVKPDFVFYGREKSILEDIKELKKRFPRVKRVAWNVDMRHKLSDFHPEIIEVLSLADYLFATSNGNVEMYKELFGHDRCFHLPQGIDPKANNRQLLTRVDHHKYDCDIMFAGGVTGEIHNNRKKIIEIIRDSDLKFNHYDGRTRVINKELSKAVQCASICLDISTLTEISCSMSVRVFEMMGAGGFLLAPIYKDGHLNFDQNKYCGTYNNEEDILKRIYYYLDHPIERQKIAEEAYLFTHRFCKYEDRIKYMLKEITRGD